MSHAQPHLMKIELRPAHGWIFVIPSCFLIALLGIPIIALTVHAVDGGFLGNLLTPYALDALRISLETSLISVLLSIIFGTPLAYILARWKFAAKSWLEVLIDLPVALPPSVAGLALLLAFGRAGVLGDGLSRLNISLPFTFAAVVVAQTFVAAPLYVRAARLGFSAIDYQLEEAAHVEGANQWQLFREVMFPLAGRGLLNGAILTG